MYTTNKGFTLVEVLVASTIGAFIMLVAVGTLRAITASSEMVENNISAAAEVRFASSMIATDLVNIYRDKNKENTKFIALTEQSQQGNISYLVFYTVNRTKARIDQPEGDIYEVEYYLLKDEEKSVLMRRLWPNPDQEETEPRGILTVLAENIDVFEVRYFDGEDWSDEWPEEMEILPQLIEVNIVAKQQEKGNPTMESFFVNFARSTAAAIDAFESTEQAESNEESAEEGREGTGVDIAR
ncbi:MAG: type II secretion system protein GspJ [Sedimentisphaerales bacterium]